MTPISGNIRKIVHWANSHGTFLSRWNSEKGRNEIWSNISFLGRNSKKNWKQKTGFEKNLEVKLFYSSKADANQKRKKVSINKQTKKCRSAMFHIFICCLFFNLPDVIKTYNSCGEEKNSRTGLLFYSIFLFQKMFQTTCFLENGLSGSNGCLVTKSSFVCILFSSFPLLL